MAEVLNINGTIVDVTSMRNDEILSMRGLPTREEAIELMYRQAVKLIDDTLIYGEMNSEDGFKSYNVEKSINIWLKNKLPIIEKMERQQNYNGHFQCIINDTAYIDSMHDDAIRDELDNICEIISRNFKYEKYTYKCEGSQFNGYSYEEIKRSHYGYNGIVTNLMYVSENVFFEEDISAIKEKYMNIYADISKAFNDATESSVIINGEYVTRKSREDYRELRRFIRKLKTTTIDDAELIELLNRTYGMRFVIGLKAGKILDRLINKICPEAKNDESWNSCRARLGDLLNPICMNGKTVYSVNYVDYLTSSMGRKWRSCHNIDKMLFLWKDNGEYAEGCRSSGCLSYACDEHTVVTYLLKDDNKKTLYGDVAKEFELALIPKDMRNLIHVKVTGDDNYYVQGRIYPQGNDDFIAIYNQFNENHKKFFCSLVGGNIEDMTKEIGCSACGDVLIGVDGSQNYKDWEHFDNCTLNYFKDAHNFGFMLIGYKHMALNDFSKVALVDYALSNKKCYNNILKDKRDRGEYRVLDINDDAFWTSLDNIEAELEAEKERRKKDMFSRVRQTTITGVDVWVYECTNGDWLIFEEKDKLIEYMTSHAEEC